MKAEQFYFESKYICVKSGELQASWTLFLESQKKVLPLKFQDT